MFRLLCLLTLLTGTAAAQSSSPEIFPPDYLPEDFAIVPPQPASTTKPQPQTFSVNQLKRQSIIPSNTQPIALPPASTNTSPTIIRQGTETLRPLSAVFPVNPLSEQSELSGLPPRQSSERSASVGGPVSAFAPSQTMQQLAANGPLNPKNGGFTPQVWQPLTTPPTFLPTSSPALKESLRRLLLTQSTPPANLNPADWFLLRTQTLEDLGLHEAAHSLWRSVPLNLRNEYPTLAQGWAESMLLAGEGSDACATARTLLANNQLPASQRPGWQAITATCAALEAQIGMNPNADAATRAQASSALGLSLQLMPPELTSQNPTLVEALTALQNGQTYAANLPVSTLAGAILATYPALIDPAALPQTLATLPDMSLRRLRQTSALPLPLRIHAAQALVAQTSWLPDGLALVQLADDSLSERSELSESPPRRSPKRSEGEGGHRPTPATAPAATLAWAGQPSATALLNSSPTQLTPSLTHTIITAALLMGDTPTASKWSKKTCEAPCEAPGEPHRGETEERSRVALALKLAQNQPITEDEWLPWLTFQPLGTPAVAQHVQRTLLVAEALGQSIPPTIWQTYTHRTMGLPTPSNPAWQRLLTNATQQQNIPQTLALLTQALHTQPIHQAPPETAAAAVKALQSIGLPQLALRLAMEAILPNQFDNAGGQGAQPLGREASLRAEGAAISLTSSQPIPTLSPTIPNPTQSTPNQTPNPSPTTPNKIQINTQPTQINNNKLLPPPRVLAPKPPQKTAQNN